MNNINHKISYLFNLYYTRQATANEVQELFQLLKEHAVDDEQLTALMQKEWEGLNVPENLFDKHKSEAILKNILTAQRAADDSPRIKSVYLSAWFKIAATVLLTLSIGTYFYIKKTQQVVPLLVKAQLPHDALPGENKAILTLANGSTVVLDDKQNGLVAKQGNTLIIKSKDGQVGYKPTDSTLAGAQIAYNTISTPRGYQYQVVLPDGSRVWLNAASSLRFPTQFKGKERDVEITGEAYFEVAKNPDMPFIVKVNREEVRVLGTHFCIMAYDDERFLKTTLLEGSIKLTSAKSANILKPGNQALLNQAGDVSIIEDADVDEAVAWKNGFFQFKDANIEGIMRQAARWYDLNVSYRGKMPERQFTGKIPRNVKLSEMLSMFKYAGINFNIEANHITVIN